MLGAPFRGTEADALDILSVLEPTVLPDGELSLHWPREDSTLLMSYADGSTCFQLPLAREQFAAALHTGHGRAPLHVGQCGAQGFEDLVLDACTRSLVFDEQSEGTRAGWLSSLLEHAGLRDRARAVVVSALDTLRPGAASDLWTVVQLLRMALIFAQEGHDDCRRMILDTFERQDFNESWVGGEELIILDGVDGFLRAAEVVGARLLRGSGYWEDAHLLDFAADHHGREAVLRALNEGAVHNERLRAYRDEIRRHEDRIGARHKDLEKL